MADEVRVWQVTKDDKLTEIKASKLNREERIEKWITKDISVLEPDKSGLLVIGEQVQTAFGKEIDLLCIDSEGDLVIVELKRDKTPREVTAQALDYASWVKDLGATEIENIAAGYLKNGKHLKDAFEETFGQEFPDVINGDHAIKVVASEIDDSTERIIRYLSEKGIDINVVRFQMFQSEDGRELLVRTYTVPPDEAEQNTGRRTKRTSSYKTLEERIDECTNEAERAFLGERLEVPTQEKNRRSLLYRMSGRIRYYLRPRRARANVIQRGRFAEDKQFWIGHLSNPNLVTRRGGVDLGFNLHSKADFEFFQHTMEKDTITFHWLTADEGSDESTEDEDSE